MYETSSKETDTENTQNSAVKEFCSSTSMHGCAHLISGTSYKLKLLWIGVIIIAVSGTVFHLYSLIDLYLQYDFYESNHKEYGTLEFPDLTMCSIEGYSHYSMYKNSEFTASKMHAILGFITSLTDEYFEDETERYSFISNIVRNEATFAGAINDMILKVGISKDEFILHCTFKDRACSEVGYFLLYQHYQYFNCYTFRFNLSQDAEKNAIDTGPENGLSIMLKGSNHVNFLYDRQTKSTNVNGLRIVIHERGTLPPILDRGIDIQPGFSTNIGLTMKKHTRLNLPYGKCEQKDKMLDNQGYVYSELFCHHLSKSAEIFEKCNCQSVKYYRGTRNFEENCYFWVPKINRTTPELIKDVFCEIEATHKMDNKATRKCVWPCQEMTYDFVMSQAEWPLEMAIKDFIAKYIATLPCESPIKWFHHKIQSLYGLNVSDNSCTNNIPITQEKFFTIAHIQDATAKAMYGILTDYFTNATFEVTFEPSMLSDTFEETEKKWIQKYFYRLNVYFTEPTIEMHKQVISFSFTDLLSSVGGVLGLWIGISVVTVVEMVVLVWKLFQPIAGSKSISHVSSTKIVAINRHEN